MGMSAGGGGGVRSEINITPLVDVVLVLLIIFMVVTPLLQVGYEVETPPAVESAAPPPPGEQLVVRLDVEGRIWLNQDQVADEELPVRLARALAGRADRIVFFAADGDLPYGRVAEFLDRVRAGGATSLGIVFEDLGAGAVASPR